MQTALRNLALATALAPTGIGGATGQTNTYGDCYFIFVSGADKNSLGIQEPISATVAGQMPGEKSTQMPVFKGKYSIPLAKPKARGAWFDQVNARVEALRKRVPFDVELQDRDNATRSLQDAETILEKLAIAGLKKRPSIGFDSNGAVSFYVSIDGFSADFTAHGDGKCSFAAKKDEHPALVREIDIGDPLPKSLASMFV